MNTNTNKYLIPGAVIIVGILIAGAFIYTNWPIIKLSSQQAADKAIAYINDNIEEGATASLVSVAAEKNVYKITLTINGQQYESYITKDGKFLFPTGINIAAPVAAEPETETAAVSDAFARCLTEKGMKFYGSKNCGWCAKEKEAFGDALQYVDYVECVGDDDNWTKECQDAQITSVPTWQLPDGTKESGFKTLEQLAEVSGCSL